MQNTQTSEYAHTPWRHDRPRFGGILAAVCIVAVGILFLLRNLGIVYIEDLRPYWPVILIAVGFAELIHRHRLNRSLSRH